LETLVLTSFQLVRPVGCGLKPVCRLPVNYTHHRHLLLLSTQSESWCSFHRPRRLILPRWTVTHPSTNRARRTLTTLIETNALPLNHATGSGQLVVTHLTGGPLSELACPLASYVAPCN